MAEFTLDMRGRGCELLLARVRKPVLTTLQANPYRDGATRHLLAFPSVRDAYAYAQEKLQAQSEDGWTGSTLTTLSPENRCEAPAGVELLADQSSANTPEDRPRRPVITDRRPSQGPAILVAFGSSRFPRN